ncbi:MAG: TRAP transporter small permease [Elioraea sp.]|nr:TRAP transporter small permease [Elioraea sp.]MDW8444734.1 TRAP transporter small permease [Acetobacteraceae bacterium]
MAGEGAGAQDGVTEQEPGYERLLHEQEERELHEPPGDWRIEDWIAFAIFWVLAAVVFLQFFTRYVLNDSIAWTEEIARYLLICTTFVGAAMAARKGSHIALDLAGLALPRAARRWFRLLLDLVATAFFALATWLCLEIAQAMWHQPMVVIDVPLGVVYYVATFGLALTTIRFAWHAAAAFRGPAAAAAPASSRP